MKYLLLCVLLSGCVAQQEQAKYTVFKQSIKPAVMQITAEYINDKETQFTAGKITHDDLVDRTRTAAQLQDMVK